MVQDIVIQIVMVVQEVIHWQLTVLITEFIIYNIAVQVVVNQMGDQRQHLLIIRHYQEFLVLEDYNLLIMEEGEEAVIMVEVLVQMVVEVVEVVGHHRH